MPLPVDDWQFWVVTALACAAAFVVARMVLPRGLMPRRWRRRGEKRATLTVDGKTVSKRGDRGPPE